MSKQKPMLMESPLTDCVYIVTSYVDNGNGMFTARQKYDVTEQFEAIAKHRERNAELTAELEARDKYPDGFVSHSEMMERVGELEAEVRKVSAECERLRNKLGIAFDKAHDILSLANSE